MTDPNMKEISEKGACVCNDGYKATQIDLLGFPITDSSGKAMIKCEACPANEYKGSASGETVWDCVACPDPRMVYDSRF